MTPRRLLAAGLLCASLTACVTSPESNRAQDGVHGPAHDQAAVPSAAAALDALEQRHYARAQAYVRDSNWAEARLEWELLVLLQPNSQAYRESLNEVRTRIASVSGGLMRAAELARKRDDLESATQLYLRVIYVDRDNALAAQALRDIDAERNKRAYGNRQPRSRI